MLRSSIGLTPDLFLLQSVPLLAQNGPIVNYWIRYQNNETAVNRSISVNNLTTTYTIRGLYPWRLYTVFMHADNSAGNSPLSEAVKVWTLPIGELIGQQYIQTKNTHPDLAVHSAELIGFCYQLLALTGQVIFSAEQN